MLEPLIYELSSPGRKGAVLPDPDVPNYALPVELLRHDLPLPEVSQVDVTRHFTRLSQFNMAVDTNLYPLGSCTMKYNPRINEDAARLPGFAMLHPLQSSVTAQGALYLMYQLQTFLAEIGGFAALEGRKQLRVSTKVNIPMFVVREGFGKIPQSLRITLFITICRLCFKRLGILRVRCRIQHQKCRNNK